MCSSNRFCFSNVFDLSGRMPILLFFFPEGHSFAWHHVLNNDLLFTGSKYHLYSYTNLPYVFGVIPRLSCLLHCSDYIFMCWYHVKYNHHQAFSNTLKSKENRIMYPHILIIQIQQFRFYQLASFTHFSFLLLPFHPPSFFSFSLTVFPLYWGISIKPLTSVICPYILLDLWNKQGHLQTEPCGHYHK